MDLIGAGWSGMNWINLVQAREQCRALVDRVINFQELILEWLRDWCFLDDPAHQLVTCS
jgi:hypothetical protein